ncbi:hypothetical protein HPB51_009154 [Rhipicephalus microplus]|uniref:Uncharacterized protein n=1 Tax=Rhipicephalus microplus TaxID=6941 RepID=A0A9J6EZK5_RHIMP|nr:hypothetical protein HPB51_009154 [Rhipicephalus microplus]
MRPVTLKTHEADTKVGENAVQRGMLTASSSAAKASVIMQRLQTVNIREMRKTDTTPIDWLLGTIGVLQRRVPVNACRKGAELVLSNPPAYDVDNVLVSCAKHLLLSGPRGITVVSLPKTPATLLNERKALCKLYDILEPQSAQLVLPVGVNHNLSGTLSASVGDAAVSFDFGDFPAEGEARQVFVLGGSGDIYLTHVSPQDDNRSHLRPVFGPLSMQPQAEDNYGVDGFSIICLPGAVPVLAVATTGGTLYHCLALGTQNFSNGTREECEDVSLYVFEKIRLDLAFSLSTSEEEMFSCPIRLHKDPTNHQRYICVHNAGVHAVVVPFIDHLQAFAEDDTGMQMMSQLHTEMSIVESLLCTRALASSKPAPPVGVVVLPEHPGPLLIVLTASWKIVTMMLMQGYQTYLPALLSQSQQDTPLLSQGTGSSNNLVAHVKQLLEGRSLPTLSQAAEDCTPQQSLELLLTATQRIREQWFQKLEACQLLIARRVQAAHDQRDLQLEKLSGLLEELALLQQRDRELKARYEALYSTQQKLVKRVEDVLHQLQRQVPVLSAAEQAMTGELKSTEEDLKVLKESLEQAQAKLRYQQQSHKDQEASRSASQLQENLTPNQVEQIAKALKEEGDMISELVQRVTALMD